MNIKTLAKTTIILALAFICYNIKFITLQNGGSITLFSMLILSLIGYLYGLKAAFLASFAFSIMVCISEPYIIHPIQVGCDYIFPFTIFGLMGLAKNKNLNVFVCLFILVAILRFIFHSISGYVFYADYCPSGTSLIIYTITYNGTVVFPEMILSVILVKMPFFNNFIKTIEKI